MSVRITAAGAVALVCLAFLTAPVSACDERYVKKCEKVAAAAAAAAEEPSPAPGVKRKSAGRVRVIASRRSKHMRFSKRTRAPGFAKQERGLTLASAESRMTTLPAESPLARRFRGFISPQPLAQNAFEAWRKPHFVAVNLEPPLSTAADTPAAPPATAAEQPVQAAPAAIPAAAAKQDRIAPKPAAMELASAESKPITLPDPPSAPKPLAAAPIAPAPAPPQLFASETPPIQAPAQPNRFSIHTLVLALCGALGAASALRFVVGA